MNNIVLFLGAGFSVPFGYPAMDNFLFHALDLIEGEERDFLTGLMLDAREANSMIESSPRNLEDMLSLAVMGDRIGLYGRHDGPRAPMLKKIIQKIYSCSPSGSAALYFPQYLTFHSFLGKRMKIQ